MPVRHLHQTLLSILPTIVLFLLELTIVAQISSLASQHKWRKKSPLAEKFHFQFHNVESTV